MNKVEIDYTKDKELSPVAHAMLKDRYLMTTEKSPQEAFARVASTYGDDEEHAQRIYDYASKQWLSFATPVLTNGGNKRGLPISCYLGYTADDTNAILDSYTEAANLTRNGGGIGYYMGDLRSDNEATSIGTKSTGVIGFIKPFETLMLAFAQGQNRRGAVAVYMDISHPEIEEFIAIRKPGGDVNRKCHERKVFHHAVNIPDAFVRAVEEDDSWNLIDPHSKNVKKTVRARDLWTQLLETRAETGEPFFMFIDEANRKLPKALQEKGLKIRQSNLCVAPETPILTKHGYVPIVCRENEEVEVWNGEEWSEVEVKKTGTEEELLRVTFSDGSSLDCTHEHKFYVQEGYSSAPVEYKAQDLYSGAKLEKFALPTDTILGYRADNPSDKAIKRAYSKGFYAGDGNEGYNFSWVYPAKHQCINSLIGDKKSPDSLGRIKWVHVDIPNKFEVPFDCGVPERVAWLAGLLDADGCVIQSANCQNIQLTSVKPQFLHEVKLFLQEMGVNCTITHRRDAGEYLLPANDGSGENKLFNCQEVWLLNVNGFGTKRLVTLGISTYLKRLQLSDKHEPQRDASRFVTVSSIEFTARISDTYCFTEPKRHRGMFNGILTGNCNEIYLPTDEERTAVCCLSSVNLEKFDEWENDPNFIEDVVRMLDNVLSDFISKAQNKRGFHRAVTSAMRERSIGLGAMGFHSYLQMKGIPFESALASSRNRVMFRTIKEKAVAASQKLAKERGEAPDMIGTGMRHAHLMAVAPNASSSDIIGTSPSIEPLSANVFTKKTESGSFSFKNHHLKNLLGSLHKDTEEVWKSITANEGSVQHLDFLTNEQKDVFKTAWEMDQRWIIEHAAVRQEYICQGQSVNVFFRGNAHKKDIHDVHMMAWKKGLKGLYYFRSTAVNRADDLGEKIEREVITSSDNKIDEECFGCSG